MDKEYKKKRVYRVFEKISQHYDGANHRISFGLQTSWKKMLTNRLIQKSPKDEKILDLCCGFRVIIMTVANSLRKSRVPDALPMFGTREYMSLSIL